MKDYVGMKYGDYTITKYLGKQTYEAVCDNCGKVRTYRTPNIRWNNENGGLCSCSKSGITIGDRFGRLVIKYRDFEEHTEKGVIYWLCQCDCGNTTTVKTKSLKNGNTRSCGCLNDDTRRERIVQWNEEHAPEMVGRISGWLTVLREALPEETIGRPIGRKYWYCECKCGNHHCVETSDFTHGKVQSCGCLNSKGEAKITSILEDNNITFVKQYTFPNFVGKGGKPYSYDFAIIESGKPIYLIEFDGIQHFSPTNQFSNVGTFEIIQERDKTKNEYARLNNLPLIRIPYTHFEKLEYKDLDLKTSQFVI